MRLTIRNNSGSSEYMQVTLPCWIHNVHQLKERRKDLRKSMTSAEAKLWSLLKNSGLFGRKFRRQHSVGQYILDFYCPSEKLAIELDGQGHFEQAGVLHDSERTAYLESLNIRVLRLENKLVFESPDSVLEEITRNFKRLPS